METKYLISLAVILALIAISEQACPPWCGVNAYCDQSTNFTCQCPNGYVGFPFFYCFVPGTFWCNLWADPKIIGFSGDNTRIKLACRAHVARFDVAAVGPFGSMTDGEIHDDDFDECDCEVGMCRVVLKSDIEMSPAPRFNYYVGETLARIVVNKGRPVNNNVARIRVRMNGDGAWYSTRVKGTPWSSWVHLPENTCTTVSVCDADFVICYDNGMWSIKTTDCGTLGIYYRAWNITVQNQSPKAGLAVAVKGEPICLLEATRYPRSFCHVPPPIGLPTVYGDFKKDNGFNSRWGSTVYAMLTHPVSQVKPQCKAIQQTWDSCNAGNDDAVNACENITLYWAKCADANGRDPLVAFQTCLDGYCNSDPTKCSEAAKMVTAPGVPECPATPPDFGC